jgi:hypothetical protein
MQRYQILLQHKIILIILYVTFKQTGTFIFSAAFMLNAITENEIILIFQSLVNTSSDMIYFTCLCFKIYFSISIPKGTSNS